MNILWCDLETTGLNVSAGGTILEFGMILTDARLERLELEGSWVVRPDDWPETPMPANVAAMHTRNGLLAAVDSDGLRLAEVDEYVAAMLDQHTVDGKIALAGSGVSHFDGRFIRALMPETAKRLTYWSYDVGVVRRFLRDLCGVPIPDPSDEKPHRALDDIRLHLAEARTYIDIMRQEQR